MGRRETSRPLHWFEKGIGSLDQSDAVGDAGSGGFRMTVGEPTGLDGEPQHRGPQTSSVKGQVGNFVASWTIRFCHSILSFCGR